MSFEEERDGFLAGKVLLFDKPINWTSFNLVKKVKNLIRNRFNIQKIKVGHAGTLDPLATGLLLVCTGKATKTIQQLQEMQKEYIATIHLGKTTPSYDLETEVDQVFDTTSITREKVTEAVNSFIGEFEQVPPMFSAKNINGQRAYKLARKGQVRELKPSKVVISDIEILDFNMPDLRIRVVCSKGTYIRALARDIGISLGNGAYLSNLIRTKIGDYQVDNALTIEEFEKSLKLM
ncbi:MAG: tRNA pseudouridine(55) synthase TruB [Bacteroidales bacterium]|nr:tRNA pseudouridine(55) synthase TruB [Bacteroidales bacterium]